MQYHVVFTPEAQEQLAALYRYIAAAASPEIAQRYTSAIVSYCEGLQTFQHRGIARGFCRTATSDGGKELLSADRFFFRCPTFLSNMNARACICNGS